MEQAIKHPTEPQHPNLRESTRNVCREWLSNGHKLFPVLPEGHTNLGGQVLGVGPLSHPSLQEGCVLTEGLSAMELPCEQQRAELEMTDSKGYHLYLAAVPRENKEN